MIIFGLFEIVLIILGGFVGSCSVSIVVFPLGIDGVFWVLIVRLFGFIGTGI